MKSTDKNSEVMTDTELKFEKVFKICTMAMRLNRCHPGINRDKIWITQFILVLILSAYGMYVLANSLLFHQIPSGRYPEATKNCILFIVAITCTIKYFIILNYRYSVLGLIRTIDYDYELTNLFPLKEKKTVLEYSKRGVKVCKLWSLSILATSAMFPLKALWLMACSYWKGEFELVHVFEITYPKILDASKNEPAMFCFIFWTCVMFVSYAMTSYIAFDPLVPIFLLHACGQLEVLSNRVEKIISDATDVTEIHENFKRINIKLQEIYRFVDTIKINFTVLYEYNVKTTTFLLPLAAFQITESLHQKEVNVEFITFFFACILHFYMPCYYSDLLMEKSERLRQAIYACGWEKGLAERRTRITVLFMLTRVTPPLVLRTVFSPICLDTFAEMCRQSYAIFNIMNAAW